MAQPRPSLTLLLDIDERLATKQTREEVGRCYDYVGSAVVRAHPAPEQGPAHNIARFMVKLGNRKYLRSADEGADELWDDVIERWLYNQFYTVGNNMQIYNRRQREIGNDELYFDYLDVDLENGGLTVRVRLDSNSTLPPDLAQSITAMRSAFNAGNLGEKVTRVWMPSEASYNAQVVKAAADKARREVDEARAAEEEAQRRAEEEAARAAVANDPENNFTEAADLVDDPVSDELEAHRAELEAKFALPQADFAIDYSIWGIESADGSNREFDSVQGAFVE